MFILLFCLSELHTMSMRLVAGGTYNVRASEMAAHLQDRQPKTVTCIVHFLDDSQEEFEIDVSTCTGCQRYYFTGAVPVSSYICKTKHPADCYCGWLNYTPSKRSLGGYIGITLSVCLFVCLSRVNLTLAITFELKEIRLSYYTCVFLVTKPFSPYQKFWPLDLDLDFWPTIEKT